MCCSSQGYFINLFSRTLPFVLCLHGILLDMLPLSPSCLPNVIRIMVFRSLSFVGAAVGGAGQTYHFPATIPISLVGRKIDSLFSGLYHCSQDYITVLRTISLFSGLYHCSQNDITVLWSISLLSGVYHCSQDYITVLWTISLFSGLYHCSQDYITVLITISLLSGLYHCSQDYITVLRTISLFS